MIVHSFKSIMTSSVKNAHEVSMKIYYFTTALFVIIEWGRIILSITVCNIYVCIYQCICIYNEKKPSSSITNVYAFFLSPLISGFYTPTTFQRFTLYFSKMSNFKSCSSSASYTICPNQG